MMYPEDSARWVTPAAPGILLDAWVEGQPLPKQRPRLGKHGAYTPARTSAWEHSVSWQIGPVLSATEPFSGPVSIELEFCRETHRRADLDNLVKAVLDALNKLAYEDDKQIVSIAARVTYGSKAPGVRVRMRAA